MPSQFYSKDTIPLKVLKEHVENLKVDFSCVKNLSKKSKLNTLGVKECQLEKYWFHLIAKWLKKFMWLWRYRLNSSQFNFKKCHSSRSSKRTYRKSQNHQVDFSYMSIATIAALGTLFLGLSPLLITTISRCLCVQKIRKRGKN